MKPLLTVLKILNSLKRRRVIRDYAIWGAVAVMRYTEPFFTRDLDILVVPASDTLDALTPMYKAFSELGYGWEGFSIMVEDLPVQFMVPTRLGREAVSEARVSLISGLRVKVLSPEYLIALALVSGREKDKYKISLLLQQAKLDEEKLHAILSRHRLLEKYRRLKPR
ncbi:MAG: hypothetical protein HYX90_12370 [Chloroflexi bacterium]|nr:hypothetical protein [Chloroflexota bacterium]